MSEADESRGVLSELQLDALRELMNVGFGQAAVALSEVIEMHVVLTVPKILTLDPSDVAAFITSEIGSDNTFSMVEQVFFGHFAGTSFLLLPASEDRKLQALFTDEADPQLDGAESSAFGHECFIEIGNIVIGACVGKIAELLDDQVAFRPPTYIPPPLTEAVIERQLGTQKSLALIFKTIFHFDHQDIQGFLFLVASESVLVWVKKAVDGYLKEIA